MPCRSSPKRRCPRKCSPKRRCSPKNNCVKQCVEKCESKDNYIFAYNTIGYTYPNDTLFHNVPIDTTGTASGWTLTNAAGVSFFTTPTTGVYQINYTATVENDNVTDGIYEDAAFRLERNGTVIPGSNSWSTIVFNGTLEEFYGVTGSTAPQPGYAVISNSILVNLNANDIITLSTAGSVDGGPGGVSSLFLPTSDAILNLPTGLVNVEPAKIAITQIA
jgi:hypothetical protein